MNIVMIGAGRVATHLGLALQEAGERVVQVFSRTQESAQKLAVGLQCPATCHTDEVLPEADLYVFSVKDSALALLASQLAQRCRGTFVHTAGSMPIGVFPPEVQHCGVLYPMQTFSHERAVCFRTIPCFLEATDEPTLQLLQGLCRKLSDQVFELSGEGRRHLHLAAVFACNFSNHCYAIAAQLLERQGLPFSCMLPLIGETASKAALMAPQEAQTGPAARGDENVMSAQLQLLTADPLWADIYRKMSESIQRKLRIEN